MRRVVVTGIGLLSPLGLSLEETVDSVFEGNCGIKVIEEWAEYKGFRAPIGAPLPDFDFPDYFDRKATRSMGRGALLAAYASIKALEHSGLDRSFLKGNPRVGVAYGSGTGSPEALKDFSRFIFEKSTRGIKATTYLRSMGHTCAANLGVFLGLSGRIVPTSSACSSGSLAVGNAYELIRSGQQDLMIAGGAEELDASIAVIFEALYASSSGKNAPEKSSRPFDKNRDGLVTGEGACSFILEDFEHAIARGAKPLAEVVGFATNSGGEHMTQQSKDSIEQCLRLSLADAELEKEKIGYLSAHATGTPHGDISESHATASVFGNSVAVSSFKGHLGHSLGGSGSTSAALSIEMMNREKFCPTLNLEQPDSDCAELDYIVGECRNIDTEYVMSNNFAFGGINTSLILKRAR